LPEASIPPVTRLVAGSNKEPGMTAATQGEPQSDPTSAARAGGVPPVAIIMGSQSDWTTMRHAAETLDELGLRYEARIVSAHRTPERLFAFAKGARDAGYRIIIAGAGGAAHLPGMTAALTSLPVFGVPVESKALSGQDSLLSIVQMPAGIPVGTLAIGRAGAVNAALLAAAVLALGDEALAGRLDAWRARQTEAVPERPQNGA
jgi:5-(carboxyamino)imidazole ribonucleotide mutase